MKGTQHKTIKISLVAAGLSLAVGCFGGPMYEPGMARDEDALGSSLTPPAQEGDPQYWDMEGDIRLFHFASGNGGRNLLFIHGGPAIPPVKGHPGIDALGGDYTIHYYHQRGSGKSSRPFDRFESSNYYQNRNELVRRLGFRAQIADIERIRKILGEEKLILVGHSFGGFFAALYAAEFPAHVERLVLISPADVIQIPPSNDGLFEITRRSLTEKRQHEFDEYRSRLFDFGSIFDKSDRELSDLQNEFIPFFIEALKARNLPLPHSGMNPQWTGGFSVAATYFDLGRKSDFRPLLGEVQAKTLVVYGESDLIPEGSFLAYNVIPGVRFEKIDGAGHFPYYDQPKVFANILRKFLNE